MRSNILLLALVLPYTFANHLQDQDDTHQDVETSSSSGRRKYRTRAQAKLEADKAAPRSQVVSTRREGRSELGAFPRLQHTDCHSGVAGRMSDRCGVRGSKEVVMTMSEGERSDVAISLTICSMASALQPIPTECHLWTGAPAGPKAKKGGTRWLWGSGQNEGDVKASRAMCISALYRSPQDWTAYNNYLSDALQLCHALRSQHAEEIAHQLYRNATQSQLDLLDLLHSTAEDRQARDAHHAETITLQLLKSEAAAAQIARLVDQLGHGSQNASLAVQEVRTALSGFEASGAGIWRDVQEVSLRRSEAILQTMAAGLEDVKGIFAQELASELRQLAIRHAEHIEQQHQRIEEELGLTLVSAKGGVELVMLQIADRLRENDLALQQWGDMMSFAQLNLAGLANDAHDLRPVLKESVASALAIQSAHNSLARSMKDTDAISATIARNLASTLSEINSTMSEVQIWRSQAVAVRPWWKLQPGFALFSSPALLTSPKLSGLISPDSLKALAYTADLSLGWVAGILYWIASTITSIVASILIMVWLGTSSLIASQVRRLWSSIIRGLEGNVDEETSLNKDFPHTPRQRLESLAPPAYASPERAPPRRSPRLNALALDLTAEPDVFDDKGSESVRVMMLRRSYGNLKQNAGARRGRRAVTAPPV